VKTELCSVCHKAGAAHRRLKPHLDPEWLCGPCGEKLLDTLAGWLLEHDRLIDKGLPEREVEKIIATLIARGARPPPCGRA
jgi:hypothetical protein